MVFQEQHFDLGNGRHFAAKVWGKASEKRYLCFHGWLDNAASFDRIAPQLTKLGQVIAVDMVGHGFSDHLSQGAHYYVWDGVEDVLRLLEVLDIEQADIIAHSLGGIVALLFAGTFSERVRKLAVIEAIGPFAMKDSAAPLHLKEAIRARMRMASRPSYYHNVEEIVRAKQIANGLSESSARAIVERNLERVKEGYCWRSDPRLRLDSSWRMNEAQLKAFFERVTCETLLILGEKGMFPDEMVKARTSPIASLKTVRVPGHHHLHMEEDTAPAVVDALMTFFGNDSAK
jgi:pimeloyl-ACP methyl ester carboxylesterase